MKRAICSLLHQNIARYEKNKGGIAEYSVDARDILIRMRFSRFIYSTKLLYGDAAERIVSEEFVCIEFRENQLFVFYCQCFLMEN